MNIVEEVSFERRCRTHVAFLEEDSVERGNIYGGSSGDVSIESMRRQCGGVCSSTQRYLSAIFLGRRLSMVVSFLSGDLAGKRNVLADMSNLWLRFDKDEF